MLAVVIVPLRDTLIVLRNRGSKAVAFGIHFATAVVMLISAELLRGLRMPSAVAGAPVSVETSTSAVVGSPYRSQACS
ncbi:DUF4267 domain-containing protein [Streptomyces mirabilis]|uniref:DUF4267 domain-containing protein n=1 Tax=Streptomyces mirabilis TaxID=68239 RepID=UPI0035711739